MDEITEGYADEAIPVFVVVEPIVIVVDMWPDRKSASVPFRSSRNAL